MAQGDNGYKSQPGALQPSGPPSASTPGMQGVMGNVQTLGQLIALLKPQLSPYIVQQVTDIISNNVTEIVTLESTDSSIKITAISGSEFNLEVSVPLVEGAFPSSPFLGQICFREDPVAPNSAGFYIYTGAISLVNTVSGFGYRRHLYRTVWWRVPWNARAAPSRRPHRYIVGFVIPPGGGPNLGTLQNGWQFVPGTPQASGVADYSCWLYKWWTTSDVGSEYVWSVGSSTDYNIQTAYQFRGDYLVSPFNSVAFVESSTPASSASVSVTPTVNSYILAMVGGDYQSPTGTGTVNSPFTLDQFVSITDGGVQHGTGAQAHITTPRTTAATATFNWSGTSFTFNSTSAICVSAQASAANNGWTFIGPNASVVSSLQGLTGALTLASADGSVGITAAGTNINLLAKVPEATSFPGSPVAGQMVYRTDLAAYFIYTSTWVQVSSWVNYGTSNPATALTEGQLFYRTDTGIFQWYTGSAWAPVANVVPSGTSDPTGLFTGQLFWRTDTSTLRLWNGAAWVSIAGSGAGVTSITGPGGTETGGLTFTGSGVSNSGTTFTFSGGGGTTASLDAAQAATPNITHLWSATTPQAP